MELQNILSLASLSTKLLRFTHVAAHEWFVSFHSLLIFHCKYICLTICLLMDIWIVLLLWTFVSSPCAVTCYFYGHEIVLPRYPVKSLLGGAQLPENLQLSHLSSAAVIVLSSVFPEAIPRQSLRPQLSHFYPVQAFSSRDIPSIRQIQSQNDSVALFLLNLSLVLFYSQVSDLCYALKALTT